MIKQYTCLLLLMSLLGCEKTEAPNNEQEHEAITSFALIFNHPTRTDTVWYDDPDGDGGLPPKTMDTIILQDSSLYQVSARLYNKTKTPVEELTEVVKQQGSAHEIFYLPNAINLSITKIDKDANGLPLGLSTNWQTFQADSGTIRIKLMHKPIVKGAQDGPEKGHSDLDISLPIFIQ